MALAKVKVFETELPRAVREEELIARSEKSGSKQSFSIEPLRNLLQSSSIQTPVEESASRSNEMKIVKAPAIVEKKASVWSEISQTWEGRVIENIPDSKEFVAIISDRTCRTNPDEEVVIGYESVLESDIELISEGAVFFWNVGKFRKYSERTGKIGPAKNKYEIRFRRLPPISLEKMREIKELSIGLSKIIHGH